MPPRLEGGGGLGNHEQKLRLLVSTSGNIRSLHRLFCSLDSETRIYCLTGAYLHFLHLFAGHSQYADGYLSFDVQKRTSQIHAAALLACGLFVRVRKADIADG